MLTLNAIIKEIKDVPVDRLEDVYQLVHAFAVKPKISEAKRKKIMAMSGCLADMSDEDYRDFENHLKQTRAELFNRKIDL
jgi:hypothetical protein